MINMHNCYNQETGPNMSIYPTHELKLLLQCFNHYNIVTFSKHVNNFTTTSTSTSINIVNCRDLYIFKLLGIDFDVI